MGCLATNNPRYLTGQWSSVVKDDWAVTGKNKKEVNAIDDFHWNQKESDSIRTKVYL